MSSIIQKHHFPSLESHPTIRCMMATAPRVLNKRTDKIPPNAVYVGRPGKWGNPYRIGIDGTREEIVEKFRLLICGLVNDGYQLDLEELRGKDLVCWCAPLPCHADVLLQLANKKEVMHEHV